ncbi:MAG: peptidylprolyl isomerase [Phycisphaeraceae bacterium]|nr:peptidylprolyl isomerase [Phycisphaeraceae bacterium]
MNKLVALGIVVATAFFAAAPSIAQLTPDRLYYGINREVPIEVSVPEGKEGEAVIELLRPVTAEKAATASVLPGKVNLATLFPNLWNTKTPSLLYAQLSVGGEKIGPALVLQPMVSPKYASMQPGSREPKFSSSGETYSGLRIYIDKYVRFDTDKGVIEFELRPDVAPNTAWNFRELAAGGFYTDVIFHRIVPTRQDGQPFVIQVGDPTATGTGGPGYLIDLEPSNLPHDFGVLSMARSGDPNSNGSQVFVCLSKGGTSFLDKNYTSFGQAIRGADVIQAIAAAPIGAEGRPLDPMPRIKSASLVDAAPYGTGPKPITLGNRNSPSLESNQPAKSEAPVQR